jgi:hypothetical protein
VEEIERELACGFNVFNSVGGDRAGAGPVVSMCSTSRYALSTACELDQVQQDRPYHEQHHHVKQHECNDRANAGVLLVLGGKGSDQREIGIQRRDTILNEGSSVFSPYTFTESPQKTQKSHDSFVISVSFVFFMVN